MENFSGKTVVITGAAAGLGRATALAFAKRGADLVLSDISADPLEGFAASLQDEGHAVVACPLDISTRSACRQLIQAAVDRFGGVDVLCNIAGILSPGRVETYSEDRWDRLMSVNLAAPFWLSQAAIPHLLERHGSIVNVASMAGLKGQAYTVPYTASKAALIQLTRSMAMEFMNKPIRINAVAPGGMLTGMGAGLDDFPADAEPELVKRYMPTRPMPQPDLVADLIIYLASDRAANIHGTCIASDGGATAG